MRVYDETKGGYSLKDVWFIHIKHCCSFYESSYPLKKDQGRINNLQVTNLNSEVNFKSLSLLSTTSFLLFFSF